MDNGTPSLDFDVKSRPRTVDDVVGQPEAVAAIRGFKNRIPRCLLFTGPSGTGKTTLARVVAGMLGVSDIDYIEKNCGSVESAIGLVRWVESDMTATAMGGRDAKRMYVLDEVQTFSRTKFAQEALLRPLEFCPDHVRFALCTTDPQRLLAAIRGRCTPVNLKPVSAADLTKLAQRVIKGEGLSASPRVVERAVEIAAGCARELVKLMEKIAGVSGETEQLAVLGNRGASDADAFGLVKALMPFKGAPVWNEVAAVLKEVKDEEPEGLRMMILACARTTILAGGPRAQHAYRVVRRLADPLYDRVSGHAILAAACWDVVNTK
jgi:DNA polymerase-3 subunit gamma/tau